MALPGPEFGDGTQWDGTSKARPDTSVYKAPDGDLGNRHSSEILALEELLKDAYATLDILANPGAANTMLGVLNDQSALEYKTLVAGDGITIEHATGSVTINSTGGGWRRNNIRGYKCQCGRASNRHSCLCICCWISRQSYGRCGCYEGRCWPCC